MVIKPSGRNDATMPMFYPAKLQHLINKSWKFGEIFWFASQDFVDHKDPSNFSKNSSLSAVSNFVALNKKTSFLRYFLRMLTQKKFGKRPDVIYLDSSHEYEETITELKTALQLVKPKGFITGDDWGWGGVRKALIVTKYEKPIFVEKIKFIYSDSWAGF